MTGGVAVVGGSGGLGEAICRNLADAGWTVVIGYFRAQDKAEADGQVIEGKVKEEDKV